MKKADIEHLASLSRIKLTEPELTNLESELSSIMTYVSRVSEIVAEDADQQPLVGAVHNIFRKDEISNNPDQFTEDVLREMPETDGRYLQVKKILQTEE